MGNAFSASDRNDEADQYILRDASDALQRVVTMDRLVPSFQNVVTQAGLKVESASSLADVRHN
jgi:transcription initiation factor TFIID subunit 2